MTHSDPRAKVLHVRVVNGPGGGPDKTIARSAAHLDARRFDVASAYLYPQGSRAIDTVREAHAGYGQTFFGIPERGPADCASVRSLVRLCKARQVDVWHGHDYKSDVLGLIVRRFHAMKVMTTVHGFTRETWRTRLYARVNDLALPGMDHVAAVSPALVEHCALCGVNPQRLSYVPNGVELNRWGRTQTVAQAKAALGFASHQFTIGVVGRLSVEKGVDRALRMFARVRQADGIKARLLVVGDGPEREKLAALAQTLRITEHVHWAGWQSATKPFYEAMDVLLLPSRTEGLPNAVLEAMAMGVPVAATQVGAVAEVLEGGRCGVLLGHEEMTWPAGLGTLYRDEPTRQRLSRLGRERVEQAYSFEQRMRKMSHIYDRLLGMAEPQSDVAADAACDGRVSPLRAAA